MLNLRLRKNRVEMLVSSLSKVGGQPLERYEHQDGGSLEEKSGASSSVPLSQNGPVTRIRVG